MVTKLNFSCFMVQSLICRRNSSIQLDLSRDGVRWFEGAGEMEFRRMRDQRFQFASSVVKFPQRRSNPEVSVSPSDGHRIFLDAMHLDAGFRSVIELQGSALN
jgi:hypothetical protein